jgi:hypothetical protein
MWITILQLVEVQFIFKWRVQSLHAKMIKEVREKISQILYNGESIWFQMNSPLYKICNIFSQTSFFIFWIQTFNKSCKGYDIWAKTHHKSFGQREKSKVNLGWVTIHQDIQK